jgi:hypothetical protein
VGATHHSWNVVNLDNSKAVFLPVFVKSADLAPVFFYLDPFSLSIVLLYTVLQFLFRDSLQKTLALAAGAARIGEVPVRACKVAAIAASPCL